MKWTVTLAAETEPGHVRKHPLAGRGESRHGLLAARLSGG